MQKAKTLYYPKLQFTSLWATGYAAGCMATVTAGIIPSAVTQAQTYFAFSLAFAPLATLLVEGLRIKHGNLQNLYRDDFKHAMKEIFGLKESDVSAKLSATGEQLHAFRQAAFFQGIWACAIPSAIPTPIKRHLGWRRTTTPHP